MTHDIAAARLLAHRLLVMQHGQVVEQGLTDQVLDDPQHAYTQLLVASVLRGMSCGAAHAKASARASRCTCRAARRSRCCAGVELEVRARRMRGAGRALGRRQVHADALPLRQLPAPARAASCCATGARWSISPRADPRLVRDVRRDTLGYVSQFLRVIPRVADARHRGRAADRARPAARRGARPRRRAAGPARTCRPGCTALPPATFSGGEQQRVNLARGFAPRYPVLLLDEPTATLDAGNRAVVIGLIEEAKRRGRRHHRHLP